MSETMIPCFKCNRPLPTVVEGSDNPPYGGTEFRTEGHYGSTFWDSFDGEELVLIICDDCLRSHTDRLAQHKRYLPIRCQGFVGLGRQWVERPMVPYTGCPDRTEVKLSVDELGTDLPGVEWPHDIAERRDHLEKNL